MGGHGCTVFYMSTAAHPTTSEVTVYQPTPLLAALHSILDAGRDPEAMPGTGEDARYVDVEDDPRGDAACPECDEGELVSLGHSRAPWADQVECDVCGFRA